MKKRLAPLICFLAALFLASCDVDTSSISNSDSSTDTTTSAPAPTTSDPTTSEPSTSSPSTSEPSTSEPSTSEPASSDSSDDTPIVPSAYYSKVDFSQTGNTLRGNLATLLNNAANSVPNYSKLNTTLLKSDLNPKDPKHLVGFYDRAPLNPVWDSGATWNKEHVWPNSRGVGKSGPGADPHMLRPTSVKVNSGRGNNFYGIPSKDGANTYDPGSEGYPEYRGMAARIIFYTATRYWKLNGLELSDNPSDSSSKKTMGKLSRLLEWNATYPVDPTETYRNEFLYKQYNVRNPFIDYPSLASKIWSA